MRIKTPQSCIDYPLNERILDNKILVISITTNKGGVMTSGYTITIRKMLEYVESKQEQKPETVDQVVLWYCRDELFLSNADFVEVFADQETADIAADEYCNKTGEYNCSTIEWFYVSSVGNYISHLMGELPKKVSYLA